MHGFELRVAFCEEWGKETKGREAWSLTISLFYPTQLAHRSRHYSRAIADSTAVGLLNPGTLSNSPESPERALIP